MKKLILLSTILMCSALAAQTKSVSSPDGRLKVIVSEDAYYSIELEGRTILEPSKLGFKSDRGDFTTTSLTEAVEGKVSYDYSIPQIKKSSVKGEANTLICTFSLPKPTVEENPNIPAFMRREVKPGYYKVEFRVSDTDVAFRYVVDNPDWASIRIFEEETAFNFPEQTTTFLTPQSDAMVGWQRTKPSYEEYYALDKPLKEKSEFGHGFTFPCLFKVGDNGWALISESGTSGQYCGCKLSDWQEGGFRISFPMMEENGGNGTIEPAMSLPGATPWRTLAIGTTLKPVTESTVTWDVAEQLYEPSIDYKFGKSTWSWILWQDASCNYDDQVTFIDLAKEMNFQFVLIDAGWDQDKNIGYARTEELIRYAHSKGIDVFLWYSSSGYWNDIYQSPVNKMDNTIARKKEMKWLKEQGVKGIKVDFFGGDKQETIRIYEGILSDANDYGLMCIFHGATIPRGWERMYPNYVGSEAVRASENLIFGQHECDVEAQSATIHPFIRNAAGCMEFGGTFLNTHFSKDNEHGTIRRTTNDFELATAVLFQNPVQNFAIAPNNLTDSPAYALDFMRQVPTTWDDIRYIDGYPGRNAVVARQKDGVWYIAAINAESTPYALDLNSIAAEFGSPASVTVLHGDAQQEKAINYKAKAKSKAYKSNVISIAEADGAVIIIK
ncbi:MAG: glycoside hydrolase family 97 catalytic domain-containing protein [Bacteroidia bacterium]|nr:glycoside hydrolase family 97 catalytic domain-containing protein [Bacteroidia bacterium]